MCGVDILKCSRDWNHLLTPAQESELDALYEEIMKSDTKAPVKQNQTNFTASVVPGAARKAVNKQIGETAIRAPKTKSDKHTD